MKKLFTPFVSASKKYYIVIFALLGLFISNGISAQCIDEYVAGTSIANGNGYWWGDSFIATCSGKLEYVGFFSAGNGTIPAGKLYIFAGSTVTGTPIDSVSYGAITAVTDSLMKVNITGNFRVVADSQYTFEYYINGVDVYYYPSFSPNPGEAAFQDGTPGYMIDFRASILGTTGIAETQSNNGLHVYPNPSNGKFIIQTPELRSGTMDVYNLTGQKVLATTFKQQTTGELDLSGFPKGVYFVKVSDGEQTNTERVVVE